MQPAKIAKRIYRRLVVNNDIKLSYRKWVIYNCQKSSYGRRLRELKDIHKGEKCIVVGNGPSLTSEDLDAICDAEIITFGTNRVFKIFSDTKWRPTYYVTEDPDIVKGCCDEIDAVSSKLKLIPLQIKWYETNKKFSNAEYFWLNYEEDRKFKYSFSPAIDQYIDHTGTVTCTCLQIAAYMGFSEIYLIGIDHNFKIMIDENGNKVEDKNMKDHFCEQYNDDYVNDVEPPDMRKTTQSYKNAKTYCEENNIKIYNSTRGGRLEVFERKPLEEVIG